MWPPAKTCVNSKVPVGSELEDLHTCVMISVRNGSMVQTEGDLASVNLLL